VAVSVVNGRTFDREVNYDDRSLNYLIRGLFAEPVIEPRSYTWRCDPHLDQGPDGACVGFSIGHEIAARPRELPADVPLSQRIYTRGKQIDEWAGEDYDGTSVLAGLKATVELGYYTGYRWARTLQEALVGVSRKGPGILGCWWYESMFDTSPEGFLHVHGDPVGGHAILVKGVDVPNRTVTLHQSWGPQWGMGGDALMHWSDFETLLLDQGEFALPVRA
jgi:hypothetical protein